MTSTSAQIHPTAIVEDGAVLGDDVTIGPFCTVGSKVKLADRVKLQSHVVVMGNTDIGEGTKVFPNAVLGGEPQNIHYRGEDTKLIIGNNCTIREAVTMNTGMPDAGGETVIGNDCLFLINAHVAHDCRLGNNIILSNNAMLAGHVEVDNNAILGGGAAVHQFVRIGHHAFIGGMAVPKHDVIPFGMVDGFPGYLAGLNIIGLQRNGFDKAAIKSIRQLYKKLFSGEGYFRDRLASIDVNSLSDAERDIYDFVSVDSKRGLTFAPSKKSRD